MGLFPGGKRVMLIARVIDKTPFATDTLHEGDIVLLTRDDREVDGTIATDVDGTFGRIGQHYELLDYKIIEGDQS